MKKTNFLRLCSIFLIMLFLTIMHSGCKKDLPGQGDSGGGINLQGQVITDFHLSYGAKEISYCKYKLPVSTAPDKSSKYLNTIPNERTYHMSFDLSSGNLNMEIDQMNFSSPVDSWNQGNNNINKLVNDGINVTAFDAGGRKIFSQSASLSKPNPQEIIQSMAEVIDNRPLAQKMQDLSQKGALVKELTNAYAVRTEYSNSNFGMNTISIYSKDNGHLVYFCQYDDADNTFLVNRRIVKYIKSPFPTEVYSENMTRLPDGDIETAVDIISFNNFDMH